jgi:8-oxo-dGTP pyrophosphatase MutT (NUDIX family)
MERLCKAGQVDNLPRFLYKLLMTKIIYGERIGKQGKIRLGCSAVIFDEARKKVLLTRRSDNGLWCLPGGAVDPGETVEEACVREIWEETGLQAQVVRLAGVYSDPNRLIVYPDGNKVHVVALNFEAQAIGGKLGLSNETTAWDFFTPEQAAKLEMLGNHLERIQDTIAGQVAAFIR